MRHRLRNTMQFALNQKSLPGPLKNYQRKAAARLWRERIGRGSQGQRKLYREVARYVAWRQHPEYVGELELDLYKGVTSFIKKV